MGMGDFLFKKFIKDHENVKDVKVRDSYGKLAGIVGIISNGLLCIMKIMIGLISGSIAIVADGINNLADASSSVITLAGFRLASIRNKAIAKASKEYIIQIDGDIVLHKDFVKDLSLIHISEPMRH